MSGGIGPRVLVVAIYQPSQHIDKCPNLTRIPTNRYEVYKQTLTTSLLLDNIPKSSPYKQNKGIYHAPFFDRKADKDHRWTGTKLNKI